MTHAFEDILRRRQLRERRRAWAEHALKRASRWLVPLAATSLLLCVIAGFAEGRFNPDATFEGPWSWLSRAAGEGLRPIAPLTGMLLVLFVGGWMTVAGLGLIRLGLRFGYGPLAIARSVIDEAIRNKIVILTLAVLLIALAVWPYSTTSASEEVRQPLRYQIQSFLSFSSLMTGLLLGAVTIFFGAHTISQDISVRRAGDVFVKPIGRFSYLLGKWLGVMLIVGLVLAVQTTVVYGVARHWLGTNYVMDTMDLVTINQRVLIARGESLPEPERPFEEVAEERLRLSAQDQALVQQRGYWAAKLDIENQLRAGFLSVQPGESKTYVFRGLQEARARAIELDERLRENAGAISQQLAEAGFQLGPEEVSLETVAPAASVLGLRLQPALLQWRFKVKGVNDYGHLQGQAVLRVNGRTLNQPLRFVINEVQVIDLPATYVDEQGELRVELLNVLPDSNGHIRTMQFDPETWIQIYYVQSGFGSNLVRASVVQLVRLAFLAMVALIAGALWSFPVAATFTMSLWVLAAGGAWLEAILTHRLPPTEVAAVDVAFTHALMPVVSLVAGMLSVYSQISVGEHLVDGRYISYHMLTNHIISVGIIWMGLALLLGGWLFNRREIARVQV